MCEFQNRKTFLLNWSEEVFVIIKIENPVLLAYVIDDLNGEEIIGTF